MQICGYLDKLCTYCAFALTKLDGLGQVSALALVGELVRGERDGLQAGDVQLLLALRTSQGPPATAAVVPSALDGDLGGGGQLGLVVVAELALIQDLGQVDGRTLNVGGQDGALGGSTSGLTDTADLHLGGGVLRVVHDVPLVLACQVQELLAKPSVPVWW